MRIAILATGVDVIISEGKKRKKEKKEEIRGGKLFSSEIIICNFYRSLRRYEYITTYIRSIRRVQQNTGDGSSIFG